MLGGETIMKLCARFCVLLWFLSMGLSAEDYTYERIRDAILSNDIDFIKKGFDQKQNLDLFDAVTQNSTFQIALENAKTSGTTIVELFLDNGRDPNQLCTHDMKTPLYLSTQRGDDRLTELLTVKGADPFEVDGFLSHGPDDLILSAIIENNIKYMELCLEQGYNPNYISQEVSWDPPIIIAIIRSKLEIMKLLLDYGAAITTVNMLHSYMTPLAIAIKQHGENSQYVELLKRRNAYNIRYEFTSTFYGRSEVDRLRIRMHPSLDSAIIGFLMKGDVVEMLEVTPLAYKIDRYYSPWIRIKFNNIEGWVYGGYIKPDIKDQGI
jgi:hypothetical protein